MFLVNHPFNQLWTGGSGTPHDRRMKKVHFVEGLMNVMKNSLVSLYFPSRNVTYPHCWPSFTPTLHYSLSLTITWKYIYLVKCIQIYISDYNSSVWSTHLVWSELSVFCVQRCKFGKHLYQYKEHTRLLLCVDCISELSCLSLAVRGVTSDIITFNITGVGVSLLQGLTKNLMN